MPTTSERPAIWSVLHRSIGVVKRCKIDSVSCGNCLNLLDPLLSDEPSSLREGLEPVLQSKSHTFKQTSMDHIRERMPVQNSMKIGRETQSASDPSQAAKEDFRARHLRTWRQVLGVARIANDCVGSDAAQQ